MQRPHRTTPGLTRVGAAHARRIGLHGADLVGDRVGLLAQAEGVGAGVGHLLPVQPGHARGVGEHGLGLDQDHLATALEIAIQALAIAQAEVLGFVEQRLGLLERVLVALLLEARAQIQVQARALGTELAHCLLRLVLETGLAPV